MGSLIMIARILIPLLILIALPDLYVYWHYKRRKWKGGFLKRLFWWMPCLLMMAYTLYLACQPDFAPANHYLLDVYLILLGVIVIPKVVYAFCSMTGLLYCRMVRSKQNYGNLIGLLLGVFVVYVTLYSYFIGSRRLAVRQETFTSKELPKAFDGYRIVQFSDAHVGSIPLSLLEEAVDSMNAQQPDLIVFTGDLQNIRPQELDAVMPILSRLQAKDGVYSILGNHDYTFYMDDDAESNIINEEMMKQKQHAMGWKLLLDEHVALKRGGDEIVLAGMENLSQKPEQSRGDVGKTIKGIKEKAFVVMLQHDPSAWKSTILPETNAQLTLSGHTHGGQFQLFGLNPASIKYDEYDGMYQENKRALNVSSGLGGLVPFRFGVTPEFVVITLRR